ncbi:MAG: Guanine deaminase [Syntrophus sp. PtaU1.Bin208]|nr:MAG: Guanine deaminase [Syntrophus sp. PtaU1.Bin208]
MNKTGLYPVRKASRKGLFLIIRKGIKKQGYKNSKRKGYDMGNQQREKEDCSIFINLPSWVFEVLDFAAPGCTDEDKMRLTIRLACENVLQGTGGPFGAAIFHQPGNRLVAVGVNSVERLQNAILHAEVMAIMLAEARLKSYSLRAKGSSYHELITSCEPCAMCLGAALWSGARRIVCGAGREDASGLGFEEGPVFPESYRYLEARGIEIVHGVLADEARAVFDLYRQQQGLIYNA